MHTPNFIHKKKEKVKMSAGKELQLDQLSSIPNFSLTYKDTLFESSGELNFPYFKALSTPEFGETT